MANTLYEQVSMCGALTSSEYVWCINLFYMSVQAWFDVRRVFCFCTCGTHAYTIEVVGDLYCVYCIYVKRRLIIYFLY